MDAGAGLFEQAGEKRLVHRVQILECVQHGQPGLHPHEDREVTATHVEINQQGRKPGLARDGGRGVHGDRRRADPALRAHDRHDLSGSLRDHRFDHASQPAHCPVQRGGGHRLRKAITDASLHEVGYDGGVERLDQEQHGHGGLVAQEALRPAHQPRLLPSIQYQDDWQVGGSDEGARVVFAEARGPQLGLVEERRQSLVARDVHELGHCVQPITRAAGR